MKFKSSEKVLRLKDLCSNEERGFEGEEVVGIPREKGKRYHLDDNSIHLWHVSGAAGSLWRDGLYQVLSPEEQQRADRYKFLHDTNRFVLSRGLLRVLLTLYLGIAPESVNFIYNPSGKPIMRDVGLAFNLSYSKEAILLAFSKCGAIGADIEFADEKFEWDSIAQICFSDEEVSSIRSLPQNVQHKAFFKLWTMKEAILKALGIGLSGMRDITGKNFSELRIDSVWQIEFGNYQGALATMGKWNHLQYYRLRE